MMIKKILLILGCGLVMVATAACKPKTPTVEEANPMYDTYYEVFVRSFADSNDDGIGDLNGLTSKLDYLKNLGITGLWLMPIFPSPSYHLYDLTDYYGINPEYGTMDDFKNLIREADKRGIRIMLDMVFNHTSTQHPWFQAAINGDPKYKAYYNFATASTRKNLLGSWGQNIWHQINDQYFCGYFSYDMPDLNFYNPEVKSEIFNISKFWVDLGVDGFRLDAAQHFYGLNEYQDQIYNFKENIYFINDLNQRIKKINPDFYLIGEINLNDEIIVSEYFRGLDSPLDFPVSARLNSAILAGGDAYYTESLKRVYEKYRAQNIYFISSPFLTNHDQDRTSEKVDGDLGKMKLAAEMLMTLPGTPIIYYGEELGMAGYKSNGEMSGGRAIWDETRRLPLPFGDDYTTTWFNDASFPSVVANNHLDNAATQMQDPDSLWSTYQRIIKVRNANMALRFGNSFTPYENNSYKLQGFYREFTYGNQTQKVLVLHNLSRDTLPMVAYQGKIIYVSGTSDVSAVTEIKPKSTVIIDVTGGNA